ICGGSEGSAYANGNFDKAIVEIKTYLKKIKPKYAKGGMFMAGANVTHKTYPKTDLRQYTTKELYALYGTAERNWRNDDGAEYNRIQAELDRRFLEEKGGDETYEIGGL
ncbi:MAG: hypothetical protein ACOVJ8_01495, partial [Sediminibacterium sp.]